MGWDGGNSTAPAASRARGVKNKLLLPLIFKVFQNFEGDSLRGDPRYCKWGKKED